jgi:hypothetical protein
MSYVIRYMGLAGEITTDEPQPPLGAFLASYDPDGGPPGAPSTGIATWTVDPDQAMKFPTPAAAMLCYQQVSVRQPLRADGKPNRPLTACTVSIEPEP